MVADPMPGTLRTKSYRSL